MNGYPQNTQLSEAGVPCGCHESCAGLVTFELPSCRVCEKKNEKHPASIHLMNRARNICYCSRLKLSGTINLTTRGAAGRGAAARPAGCTRFCLRLHHTLGPLATRARGTSRRPETPRAPRHRLAGRCDLACGGAATRVLATALYRHRATVPRRTDHKSVRQRRGHAHGLPYGL